MAKRSLPLLLLSVGFLICMGIVMLVSTCAFSETASADDFYKEAKRQVVWIMAGCLVCAGAACLDYRWLQRHVWWIFCAVVFLLILCYVPGIGNEVNGERRWINAELLGLKALQIQPSELAKITLAIFLAYWFSLYTDSRNDPWRGFILPCLMAGVLILLVLFEKDMGTAAVMSASCLCLLFVAGVRLPYIIVSCGLGMSGLLLMAKLVPERWNRIIAFLDMDANRLGDAFQQWIGLMALGSGGLPGRGLGEGRLKMLYMPFAHTDFIFPMIGEELGLIFTLLVVFAFLTFAVAGIAISFHAPDTFGKMLGTGLVCYIVFQAALNIGVTTAVLPNTGIPLPLVSYGGSALLTVMAAVGILLNIYRQGRVDEAENKYWVNAVRITPRL